MPVLKKLLDGEAVAATETKDASSDFACPLPAWQRALIRVTFEPTGAAKQTFAIRGHIVDRLTEEEDEEETTK
jgi:predicted nucleotidyltransferase